MKRKRYYFLGSHQKLWPEHTEQIGTWLSIGLSSYLPELQRQITVKAINRAEQRERRKGVTTVVCLAFLDGKGRKQIGDRRLPWGLHNIVKSKELLGKPLYKGIFKMFFPYA